MHDTLEKRIWEQVEGTLSGTLAHGESELVRGAYERNLVRAHAILSDDDPAMLDRGQLRHETWVLLTGLTGIQINHHIDYAGRLLSPLISAVKPGEPPSTHALVEVRARDGRSIAIHQPFLLPVDEGVVMHHIKVFPGQFRRIVEPLLSPRAFGGELQKMVQLAENPGALSELEPKSYLYAATRGYLTGLSKEWIPVTRTLMEIEAVGTQEAPRFRLLCSTHPEVVVDVRYDPETCRVSFEHTFS